MKKLFLIVLMAVLSFGIAAVAVAGGKGEAGPQGEFGTGPIPVAKLAELAAKEGDVIVTYGLPDNWAGWKEMFEVFGSKYNKKHFDTDLSSGEEIAKMKAEKGNPQADRRGHRHHLGTQVDRGRRRRCLQAQALE